MWESSERFLKEACDSLKRDTTYTGTIKINKSSLIQSIPDINSIPIHFNVKYNDSTPNKYTVDTVIPIIVEWLQITFNLYRCSIFINTLSAEIDSDVILVDFIAKESINLY